VEINSETDFVGRSELFRRLVAEAAGAAVPLGGGGGGAGGRGRRGRWLLRRCVLVFVVVGL